MGKKKTAFCATKKCLVLTFVGILIGMGVVTTITLVAPAVRGRFPPDLPWWKTSIVYQVYPRSLKSSNGGDGGDIKGIISKLDHFVYLHVGTIWLNPIYASPMKDGGYDISNHTDVNPKFGTLADLEDLIQKAHAKDIKIILDYVPNHTSDQHKWFQESLKINQKYKDYYIWKSNSSALPNNWMSVFHNSAWTYSPTRDQYYYHTYLDAQPDLNFRNPDVVEDMKDVLKFWLERGIDGFRIDAVSFLFEDEDVSQNEERNTNFKCVLSTGCEKQFHYWRHDHTMNQPEIKAIIDGWRSVLDEYEKKDGKPRFLLAEARVTSNAVRDWWYKTGSDMPFNFDLSRAIHRNRNCDGKCIRDAVHKEYKNLSKGSWPNFFLSNHDMSRTASIKGRNFVNALNMLLLTLWGTPTTYYGEEIGMEDISPTFNQSVDPKGLYYGKDLYLNFTRDKSRSPMQWDNSNNAGFTAGSKTWLPVSSSYHDINVQKQKNSSDVTPIQVYRTLAKLRQEPSFLYGRFIDAVTNNNVFSYVRKAKGFTSYLVAINFGDVSSVDDYVGEPVGSKVGTVIVNTANFKYNTYSVNNVIALKQISLEPGQGLIIKL